jgi:Ca-activated chloride channel family protein
MTRPATVLLACVFAACACSAQEEPAATVKIDVRLVNVFVTVTDPHGAPVAKLTKDNFQLSEDGKEQKIAVFDKESALPLSIIVAVDTSLSTKKDLPLELASARHFAHTILRPVDAISLYQFSEIVDEVVPFTADIKTIDHGLDRIRVGSELTGAGPAAWTESDRRNHRRRRYGEQGGLSRRGAGGAGSRGDRL